MPTSESVTTLPRRRWALAAALLLAGCGQPQPVRRLPAAPEPFRSTDNTLVFELPDSGGYLANGVPMPAADMEAHFRAIFADRAPGHRAVFVWPAPRRPWRDVEAISRAAEAAGGHAFDAELSGWPRPVRRPDSGP